ncbi:MAG: cob(I)yrinic acid a,c-diamide adenosyltransferase [Candidatus Neomarinimicrobiota bacterium]|nr:MAG: ATP:cob(I)alamin adenosyltransferase [Candidatus Marinimicrobia bacterium TMED108]RCL90705.1 MAG: cob(I)yrinic acid a,c-diamide adenosyltransferase [bacterium]|tara:strand:- start:1251 stop:1790 length:540 start_codon:yes stop_codon:yes gene_type:complete
MRISKVTTKSGDKGNTSLGNGERVSKSHLLINLLGDIDELNSQLGSAISSCKSELISSELQSIQQDLFNLGGEISIINSGTILINNDKVEFLEERIDELNQTLKPLKEFIMPGGDEFCSRVHLARAVCRRAERSCVAILDLVKEKNIWLPYLNRLSDYLFVLARYVSSQRGSEEILWKR